MQLEGIPDATIALTRELARLRPDRQIARLLNRIGVETGYGNAWTLESVRGFRMILLNTHTGVATPSIRTTPAGPK